MNEEKEYSLLIVDDQASGILALANILKSEYNIYAARNGRDAIRAAAEKQPDVILLDVVMPVMDGYEVIAELKKDERTRKIPVIFVTGLDNAGDEERGLALQAADYITKPFSPAIVKLRVRGQIQIVSQLRTIEAMSMTDPLTGIPNRRSFDARLALEWNRAVRKQLPLAILMLDVDHFKIYNDTHGHQQGDAALRGVAESLSRSLEGADGFFARWGGEEFSVLLPGFERGDALRAAERIREEVAATVLLCANGEVSRVTVSIGLHVCTPAQESSIGDFIASADAALYTAKQNGRNLVFG